MIIKLLTAIAILGAVALMFSGRRTGVAGTGRGPTPPRVPHADDLVKCPDCGIWLAAGTRCGCSDRARASG